MSQSKGKDGKQKGQDNESTCHRELTEDELNEIDEAFGVFDRDGSGNIDRSEVRQLMYILGMSPTEDDVSQMMADIDANGDGTIDKTEFRDLMKQYYQDPDTEEEEMRSAFKFFDKDGSGNIDKKELAFVLCNCGKEKLTEDEVNDIFHQADLDNDGVISYEEFVKAMTSKSF